VTVRVGEVAGIAAPEDFLRGLCKRGSGSDRLGEHGVDFFLGALILRQRDASKSASCGRDLGILGELFPRVETEPVPSRSKKATSSLSKAWRRKPSPFS